MQKAKYLLVSGSVLIVLGLVFIPVAFNSLMDKLVEEAIFFDDFELAGFETKEFTFTSPIKGEAFFRTDAKYNEFEYKVIGEGNFSVFNNIGGGLNSHRFYLQENETYTVTVTNLNHAKATVSMMSLDDVDKKLLQDKDYIIQLGGQIILIFLVVVSGIVLIIIGAILFVKNRKSKQV